MARKAYNLEMAMEKPEEVEELSMVQRNLTHFPKEIFQLKNLRSLDLSHNKLTDIPEEINGLIELKALNLSLNFLSDTSFLNLKTQRLNSINLSKNQISIIPDAIFDNTELRYLNLSSNQLKEISPEISKLKALKELNLFSNQIKILPDSFVELAHLLKLELYGNPIQELPKGFGKLDLLEEIQILLTPAFNAKNLDHQLKNVKKLLLSGSKELAIPEKIYQLKSLVYLSLAEFQSTTIAPEIGNLQNLRTLNLSRIPIKKLPDNIVNLSELVQLSIFDTQIKKLPSSLLTLGKLRNFTCDKKLKQNSVRNFLKKSKASSLPIDLKMDAFEIIFSEREISSLVGKKNIFTLLNFPFQNLETKVLNYILQNLSLPLKTHPLKPETYLTILGKTGLNFPKVKAQLKNVSKNITPETTHVILGKLPGEIENLTSHDFVFVRESELNLWLQQQEKPYLLSSSKEEIENLSKLLLSFQNENIDIALQIMEAGGVPQILLTDLVIVFKKLTASKQKRAIRKLLSLNLSEKALKIVSLKTGLLKVDDLRKKILEMTAGTELDGGKITTYFQ